MAYYPKYEDYYESRNEFPYYLKPEEKIKYGNYAKMIAKPLSHLEYPAYLLAAGAPIAYSLWKTNQDIKKEENRKKEEEKKNINRNRKMLELMPKPPDNRNRGLIRSASQQYITYPGFDIGKRSNIDVESLKSIAREKNNIRNKRTLSRQEPIIESVDTTLKSKPTKQIPISLGKREKGIDLSNVTIYSGKKPTQKDAEITVQYKETQDPQYRIFKKLHKSNKQDISFEEPLGKLTENPEIIEEKIMTNVKKMAEKYEKTTKKRPTTKKSLPGIINDNKSDNAKKASMTRAMNKEKKKNAMFPFN